MRGLSGGALPEGMGACGGRLGFAAVATDVAPGALGELVHQIEGTSALGNVGGELFAGLLDLRQALLVFMVQRGHPSAAVNPLGAGGLGLIEQW